ncbi:MAG: transporter substrate-binding domain-containing protein [Deltaproteobacteria bacterium]|jgi:polar amino acid transport system substrate-binding protein|nr:transporter substrate-binding domain-containing protein [Deltaproteobacteria bacterium]
MSCLYVFRLLICCVWSVLFFGNSSVSLAQAHVAGKRQFVVGGDRNYPPYEFIDEHGKAAGFFVDLTRAIGEATGVEMQFLLLDWARLHEALMDGAVDALQRIPSSKKWLRDAELSPPAAIIGHAVFARDGTPEITSLEDLIGKKVIIHPGGSIHDILNGLGLDKELLFSDTPTNGLRQLASGTGDYAIVALLPGLSTIAKEKLDNLRVVIRNVTSQGYSYAARRGEESTLAVFNEGLALVKLSGKYQEIRHKWFGVMDNQDISWRTALRYASFVLVPLLLLLGGITLWSRSLKRLVEQRTRSLSQALEELRQNQQQLVQADKMAALGVLVSGVAHEINNPNGLILLNIPTLRQVNDEAMRILEEVHADKGDFAIGGSSYLRMREHLPRILDSMEESARRIKRIVGDLKDFSRINSPAEQEDVDLNEVLAKSLRLLETSVREATEHFSVHYAKGLPTIKGNSHRLEHVMVNLILNACQALRGPQESIAVSTDYDALSDVVVLSVQDNGVGITSEDMARLTDPFFTTKRASGGTGLGLSVSTGIVKEHGGSLQFTSMPGQGTTARCIIPVRQDTV